MNKVGKVHSVEFEDWYRSLDSFWMQGVVRLCFLALFPELEKGTELMCRANDVNLWVEKSCLQ